MEDLESILKKKYVDVRAEQFNMSALEYKMKLKEALSSGAINEGKTHYETLNNYENYLEWGKFWDGIQEQFARLIWAGNGIALTAPLNYLLNSPILHYMQERKASAKEEVLTFAALSLGEFIIEKRIGQGIINYFSKRADNANHKMKKKDHLKLLLGYVLAQFPFIKRKGQGIGQEIVDFYNKDNSSENGINGAKEGLYEDLLKANQKTQEETQETKAVASE